MCKKGPSGRRDHRCSAAYSALAHALPQSQGQCAAVGGLLGSDHQTAQHVHPALADQCAWHAWCTLGCSGSRIEPRHDTLHAGQEHVSRSADPSAWSNGIAVSALWPNITAATARPTSSSVSAARRGARRSSPRPGSAAPTSATCDEPHPSSSARASHASTCRSVRRPAAGLRTSSRWHAAVVAGRQRHWRHR